MPTSVPSKESLNGSPRTWLAWFAIPLATGITWQAETWWREGGLDGDGKVFVIWFGMLTGAACILLSRFRRRSSKWILLGLYAFVMIPIYVVIDIAFNGIMGGRSL